MVKYSKIRFIFNLSDYEAQWQVIGFMSFLQPK